MKGRGAGLNPANRFLKQELVTEFIEGLDEPLLSDDKTTFTEEYPKEIVNEINSPDLRMAYSLNPYQGCEHGCIYCYARNSHQYWGLSAGLDFERKIMVKPEAPLLLKKFLSKKNYQCKVISISGNTDCYQPVERKMRLTRSILEICLEYKQPVGIISKNALVLRDLDILREMAAQRLVNVMISITSLNESIRRQMEPRTVSALKRLDVIRQLTDNGISTGVMMAPIVPGLTSEEIPDLLRAAADHGATRAGMTIVRLNGAVGGIFKDWLMRTYPDRADKIWHHIESCHGGQVNDTRFGLRMKGDGQIAESINSLFKLSVSRYFKNPEPYVLDTTQFTPPPRNGQLNLF